MEDLSHDIYTLDDVLSSDLNGFKLTSQQKKKLKELKIKSGDHYTNMLSMDEEELLFEIICNISSYGFDYMYQYLKESEDKRKPDILNNLPGMKEAKIKNYELDTITLRKKEKVFGIYKCPKCKSENTETVTLQTRRSDEPETNFNTCNACRHQWKIN